MIADAGGFPMSILRNRHFTILSFGLLVSVVGNNFFKIALPWYVYSTTGSKLDLALTGIFQTLPGILGLFVGVFVDRWRKRETMIWTNIIRGLICVLLYVVVFLHPPLIILLILVMLLEIVGTFYIPAENAFLPFILPTEELTSAMGLIQSIAALARLFGILLGGVLISLVGAQLLFLLDAMTFGVALISLLFVRVNETVPPLTKKASFAREWLDGVRAVISFKVLLRIVFVTTLTGCVLAPLDIVMTAWVKGPLHGTGPMLGMINASLIVGIMVGGLLLGHINKRMPLKTILTLSLVVAGVSMSVIGLIANMYWAMAFGVIVGFSMGIFNGSIFAMALHVIPEQMRGRMFSIINSISVLAVPLGMALYGWMMVYVPLEWIYVLMGVPTLLSGLSFLLPLKDKITDLDKSHGNGGKETVGTGS